MPDFDMCTDCCPFSRDCRRSVDSGTVPDFYQQAWSIFEKTGNAVPDDPAKCRGWWPVNEPASIS